MADVCTPHTSHFLRSFSFALVLHNWKKSGEKEYYLQLLTTVLQVIILCVMTCNDWRCKEWKRDSDIHIQTFGNSFTTPTVKDAAQNLGLRHECATVLIIWSNNHSPSVVLKHSAVNCWNILEKRQKWALFNQLLQQALWHTPKYRIVSVYCGCKAVFKK